MALLADPLNNNWRSVHLHGHDRGASISFRMEWKRHPVALLRDIAFVQYLPWIYARDFVVALRRRMGCSPSGPSCAKGGTRLMATKLAFTKGQMHNLNAYFRGLAEEPQNDSTSATAIEAIVERLVQRLMLAAGNLDRRFSSVFLVSLNEPRRMKRLKFEYLLRIDALSTPTASSELEVEEDAAAGLPGFIRLKILDAGAKPWREYADAAGRLRRDLVKAKLANLLAAAVKRDGVEPTDANVCGSPGQVVDAEVLDKILKQPDHCRIFYGPAVSDGSSPEPREHRVALIEDSGGILLRIALDGCKSREVEVRLLIGIGLSSWPSSADYPRRVPLYHCDALLHYTVAQSGMYAVAVGPYPGARCEDRATLWGIRVPAAEKIMSQHYAADSVPGLTESVLIEILHQMREGLPLNPTKSKAAASRKGDRLPQDRLRVVSRHILRTMHRWSLERAGPDPLTCWAPDTLSRHVLLVLDELVTALKCQNLRCYFLPRCNVMLQCARGGIVHREDSYASDCRLLESYLETLHNRSLSATPCVPRPLDAMETELIARWRDIVFSLPRGTADADYGYSPRQLEYLGLILEQALRARDCTAQDYSDICSYLNFPECAFHTSEQVENLVFLLKLVLIQAKDQIRAMTNRRARERERPRDSKKGRHCNTTSQFDRSVGLLIDEVRADRETASAELESRPVMTRMLLQWLYFVLALDSLFSPGFCHFGCSRDGLRRKVPRAGVATVPEHSFLQPSRELLVRGELEEQAGELQLGDAFIVRVLRIRAVAGNDAGSGDCGVPVEGLAVGGEHDKDDRAFREFSEADSTRRGQGAKVQPDVRREQGAERVLHLEQGQEREHDRQEKKDELPSRRDPRLSVGVPGRLLREQRPRGAEGCQPFDVRRVNEQATGSTPWTGRLGPGHALSRQVQDSAGGGGASSPRKAAGRVGPGAPSRERVLPFQEDRQLQFGCARINETSLQTQSRSGSRGFIASIIARHSREAHHPRASETAREGDAGDARHSATQRADETPRFCLGL
ncbi:uncharacterized protein LOC143355596 isoform X6 [Halictus rubicundus]|uniref:uncharacterized protein LOC143355596 isoform X6 n=1 Tax=Halictus rubicundus TaxID=77578 RepID=UPI004035CB0B